MKRFMFFSFAELTILCGSGASSQNSTPRADAREHHQQQRIKPGVNSGQLTNREARTLVRQEGKIRADEMIAKSDGKVTRAERHKLHRELNHESNRIYRKKHNARTQS